jgi:predicted transcriptional regulator
MSETPPLIIRLTPQLEKEVGKVAKALGRPASWVVEQAVKEFLAVQESHLAAIDEGIQDADAGRVIPHDEVAAWVRSWDKPDEVPIPEWRK